MSERWGPADFKDRIDTLLADFLAAEAEQLLVIDDALHPVAEQLQSAAAHGKRLRAAFCYWGWRAVGQPDSDALMRAAAPMHLVHAAAIVHDDLIDGSPLRHDQLTAHIALFGQAYADGLRRRRPRPGDKWHLDEVFIKISGVRQYLWRAVDQDGNVLDILARSRRDAKAAKRFLAKLMKKQQRVSRVMVTDKLRSYGTAHRELMPSVEHRSHKGLNNRAENSHQPTRRRERAMTGFRSVGAAQWFLAAFSGTSPHFRPRRHLMTAAEHRLEMTIRFTLWDHITKNVGLSTQG
ncbi:IS6 family transposase [Streptomyces hirsutus]|uniref:IS6 family transposase n=1 Tax=Streptomyces hirsutus TaxID=35620 RepID=UPI00389AA800